MDSFAKLSPEERRIFFEGTATARNMQTQVVEKDFWVCWTLQELFRVPVMGEHLIFKGGTSLSKVFKIIERFSEDIDVSIDRNFLGFGGANEPEAGASNKEKQRRIEALKTACQQKIANELLPALAAAIKSKIRRDEKWSLLSDDDDPDEQTLLFDYPTSFPPDTAGYIRRAVKVLSAERTFWEKATILHAEFHRPVDKPMPERFSRHYCDFYELIHKGVSTSALARLDLLARVAQHKNLFFKSAWAWFGEAVKGTLRIAPPENRLKALRDDYGKMQQMFFGGPPEFDKIITLLQQWESGFNRK